MSGLSCPPLNFPNTKFLYKFWHLILPLTKNTVVHIGASVEYELSSVECTVHIGASVKYQLSSVKCIVHIGASVEYQL